MFWDIFVSLCTRKGLAPNNVCANLGLSTAIATKWKNGVFTAADGTKQNVEFMYDGSYGYISDGDAEGFIRYYSTRKYAFVAILPNEGVSVREYMDGMNGEKLLSLLGERKQGGVTTAIPKFESEYSSELSDVLKAMGVKRAFDPIEADLTGLGTSTEGNIFINRVLHKTYISVGERGTRAGAAAVVETADKAGADMPEGKEIFLDRPFIYMLIDLNNNIPFFIGCVDSLGQR